MEEDFQLAAALHLLQLRESPPPQFDTDFAFAVSLFAEDLENIDVSYSDHRIAKLYQNAQSTSGRLISQFSAVEAFESSDHDFAARLSRGTCQLDEPKSPVTLDDENLSKGIQESPLIEQWGLETLEPAFGSLGHDEFEFYTPQTMGGPSNRHYTDTFTRGPDNGTDHHNNADNRFCHSSLKLKPPVRFNLIEKRAQSFGLRYSAVDHCVACDSIEFPILLVKHMLFGESWEKYQTILNEINSPPAPPSEVVLDKAVEELALLKRWKRCPGCQALIERKEGYANYFLKKNWRGSWMLG
ncbi:hypothetical protein BJ742DRAFT_868655 [Cladochytrium replicatum]|nr:hypothetical protein BJ742DRAFT_868655 [Cladochytrium replicatum]